MARNAKAAKREAPLSGGIPKLWSEFLGVCLLALGLLVFGGLASFQFGHGRLMGPVGGLMANALYASFGMAAYIVALGIAGAGVRALMGKRVELHLSEGFGFAGAAVAACILLHVWFPGYRAHGYTAGGLLGEMLGELSLGLFDRAGTYIVALTVMCVGLLASTPLTTSHLLTGGRFVARASMRVVRYLYDGALALVRAERERDERETEQRDDEEDEQEDEGEQEWDEEEDQDDEDDEDDEDEEDPEEDGEIPGLDADEGRERARAALKRADVGTTKRVKGNDSERTTNDKEKPRKDDKRKELPEIVVRNLEVGSPRGRDKMDDDAEAKQGKHKKPPPKPDELSRDQQQAANAALATSGTASAPPPRREPIPGVIRLTPGEWEQPPLRMFDVAEKIVSEVDKSFVLEQAQRIEAALAQFKIRGQVTKIHPGPVITRYEFKPEAGVKLSKIENLENDLAMALEAIRIRILAPIPGQSSVGFEVPNRLRETVNIKEILGDECFARASKLPLALGKDITGKPCAIDLSRAPHLLVAGATGSGKSVGINSMICSLLYGCSPEDVRMIMIDPKMLELSIYEGIPHLLLPVVTDAEKANLALRWVVDEMERRYALLSVAQVRDVATYNRKLPQLLSQWRAERNVMAEASAQASRAAAEEGEDAVPGTLLPGRGVAADGGLVDVTGGEPDADEPTKLPYIVVVIDEFADLMMVASKEVENNVARIAAKARAAGIHLIVATQRPSVDVITGTIKNNFPTRIAFQVTSYVDSRTILDTKGAKQLLGMGDMLYMDRGGEPVRVHGCFVSEDEIFKVVKFIKKQAKPVYNLDIVRKRDDDGTGEPNDENVDPLYDKAVQIVAETQKVSTSMIQRRLNVGYNRAAKIVERMEAESVIGPARGTAPREVFVRAA